MTDNNDHPASKGNTKYRHLFFDLDHTLWDFESNARATLKDCTNPLNWTRGVLPILICFIRITSSIMKCYGSGTGMGSIKQDELRVKSMRLGVTGFQDRR